MDTEIMKQQDAIKWLVKNAQNMLAEYPSGYDDPDILGEIIADIAHDIDLIKEGDWEWVAIMECPMAVSNVCVKKVKIGE